MIKLFSSIFYLHPKVGGQGSADQRYPANLGSDTSQNQCSKESMSHLKCLNSLRLSQPTSAHTVVFVCLLNIAPGALAGGLRCATHCSGRRIILSSVAHASGKSNIFAGRFPGACSKACPGPMGAGRGGSASCPGAAENNGRGARDRAKTAPPRGRYPPWPGPAH